MADNLPLIPEKGSVCADVRPILRTVFRELDFLPPLLTEEPAPETSGPGGDQALPTARWIERYRSECKEIWTREGELKHQHAKRISREPLPNIYTLYSPGARQPEPMWRLERGLIDRKDLVPTIEQNAGRDGSLWIKNILNQSSCNVSAVQVRGTACAPQVNLLPAKDVSIQTLSIGAVVLRPPLPPPTPPPPMPQPDYILCVPPQLDFINFTVGHLHTQGLRLVNVSKFEIHLSVHPPKRRELDVELSGPRGLTVTSGAAAELRVHFRPSDVRAVRDTLLIRVSMGRNFVVPIACYMQPPILDILIPSVMSSLLSCTPGNSDSCKQPHGSDVLELGARLLGDVHCARVLLHCDAEHAAFFMLTEDAWFSFNLDCLTVHGSVVAGPFVLWPAWWSGGGAVRGCAWCRADSAGLHACALRVLSSTAVVRPLHVLADTLLFRPDHLTIEAQEKDYDICGDGEPACKYYVHLGMTFPHRSLSATVQLINHSSVVYSYYWSVRPWGACSCWEDEKETETEALGPEDDSDRLCIGAKEARSIAQDSPTTYESKGKNARLLCVEPARGQIMPRSMCALHVQVPDVGTCCGVQRAVLMLILKDIPKESFPSDYDPMIVSEEEVETEPVPGVESVVRAVCEVVYAQMEVWWEVAPVRFVLDPPVLPLYHSRRIESVTLDIVATQLFGCEGVRVSCEVPARVRLPLPLRLSPAQGCHTDIVLPLPILPNHFPETDIISMVAANEEWRTQCSITRQCETRHPALQPGRSWLGVVAPGTHMHTRFQLFNDTHQHICWWAEAYRWWGENVPSPACLGRTPCEHCQELACSCGLLKPARGALHQREIAEICYDVNAPECDGCVATLVQARRTGADVARVHGAAGSEARAALVAYRVLAPRLVLRLLPCFGDATECCKLDPGYLGSKNGTATLRPQQALTLGRRTCYRLQITNITPLPTAVHFDRIMDAMDVLKVKFSPNDFSVRPYGEMEVRVVVEARKVCGRRLFVYRAKVDRAYKPLYLMVDTAIDGLKIACEVPLGGARHTDSFVIMRRTQREEHPGDHIKLKPSTPEEMFAAEDRKRQVIEENRCRCSFEMVYIPPKKPPAPPRGPDEYTPPEIRNINLTIQTNIKNAKMRICQIVTTPPGLTRVCSCLRCTKSDLPELDGPICLQFTAMPLRKVCTRTLLLRNESVVTAKWSTAIRRWPRKHIRKLATDQWLGDVTAPGVAIQCAPSSGVLAAYAHVLLHVRVYADCWGLYYDQILIQIDNVEPIILDVWMESVGPPLQMALKPSAKYLDLMPCMWMSASDPERVLRAKNVSRSQLIVHAYITREYEYPQDMLPFRLYLRFYDVLPRTCPCVTAFDSDHLLGEDSESTSLIEEMDTGFELYLAPDYGPQNDTFYTVSPEVRTVSAGECVDWEVTMIPPLHGELAPDVNLLLRLQPIDFSGPSWHRPEPPAQVVRLQQSVRHGRLKVSCCEQRVKLCALDLPYGDVLRVRKRFYVANVGNGPLELGMETKAPWCVVTEHAVGEEVGNAAMAKGALCGSGCLCHERFTVRDQQVPLYLEPRSSVEMCVEVVVSTEEAWPGAAAEAGPGQAPAYPERLVTTTPLYVFDDDNILLTLPLVLDLEYPILRVEPLVIDFGFVTDGDTRKTYFSVSHTSRNMTLDIATHWEGGKEFQIWPRYLRIAPGRRENVYLQYTAIWRSAPTEGCARVNVCCGAGTNPADCTRYEADNGKQAKGAGQATSAGQVQSMELAPGTSQQAPATRLQTPGVRQQIPGMTQQTPGANQQAPGMSQQAPGDSQHEPGSPAWCRASVIVRASPALDNKCHLTKHDHTDDPHLMPPGFASLLSKPTKRHKTSTNSATLARI